MNYSIKYFEELIHNSDNYWAHLPIEEECNRQPEKLSEHSSLVISYAKTICEKENLNSIIENLIFYSLPENLSRNRAVTLLIEDLFWQSIAFHDLGKVNKDFQSKKMDNRCFTNSVKHSFGTEHSVIGVYIYLLSSFIRIHDLEIDDKGWYYICNLIFCFAYSIYRHHHSTIEEIQEEYKWSNSNFLELRSFIPLFNITITDDLLLDFEDYFLKKANLNFDDGFFNFFNSELSSDKTSFPLYLLIKLNYSLLTASDYLATSHYINNWDKIITDYALIDIKLRDKIIYNAENYIYNKPVFKAINNEEIIDLNSLQHTSFNNLNYLRKSMAIDVVKNIRKNYNKDLFYIEAPTGGGKTNLSILALSELLRQDEKHSINKIFYVFPFTTLITQTYKSLVDTLDLKIGEIAEVHSKASFQKGFYKDDYYDYIDSLFMNYPITILSHIKFFEILKTNNKEANYLLHRLANSIVVIDEIQSYSPSIWDKIAFFITNYARYLNIKFIIMSATLPKIGELINDKKLSKDFIYLINDKNKYFHNKNFCGRVNFDYSLLEKTTPTKENKKDYLVDLSRILIEKSIAYSNNNIINFNSVYTIIEFIYKKTASDFYNIIQSNNTFFDEIFLLSGTILEPKRKDIINKLKSLNLRRKKVLLISTQVIEAGVDIDMDLGFKDKSIIDSDEQLAGRINRNSKKDQCTLYLFNCDSASNIYGKDYRYEVCRAFKEKDYKEILDKKDFDKLYSCVIKKINGINDSIFIENINSILDNMAKLNFRGVNDSLKIIESNNISIFVPLDIDIIFLEEYKDICIELKIINNGFVSGKDVWLCYENILMNNEDFIIKKIKMLKLRGLMSNYIFSLFFNSNEYTILRTYGEEKYGFLYLENYSEIYDYNYGIKTEKFSDSNFL